jgi:hypothetical protein
VSNINVTIIDQQVRGIAEKAGFAGDESRQRSTAFVMLCVKTLLDLDGDEARDCLTDGGQDMGIDALHVGDMVEGEFVITLFQGKYKQRLDGESAFPAGEMGKIAATVATLFDPDKSLYAHPALTQRIEEIRSLIRDGWLPRVRVVLCNNGKPWGEDGQAVIAGFSPGDVIWEHLGPDRLLDLMRPQVSVKAELRLAGKVAVEELDFRRVLIGKLPVTEVAALFEQFGDRLLEKNIRRYLGRNPINRGIERTLRSKDDRSNFYFFNNGVTMVCSKFRHNKLQAENHVVRVDELQIINGGQTCSTIRRVLAKAPDAGEFAQTFVLVRLYELEDEQRELIRDITYATNSQNPVDLRDLRANDPVQERLEMGLGDLGVTYRRKRAAGKPDAESIDPTEAAEAVLAIWRRKPHLARFDRNRHFGRLYDQIFTEDLAPAQVIVAVEILRRVEERRRQPPGDVSGDVSGDAPRFLPYASHFLAMLIGEELLRRMGIDLRDLTHLRLDQAKSSLGAFGALYEQAVATLRIVLRLMEVSEDSSLQKLSATFRRGDLLEALPDLRARAREQAQALVAKSKRMTAMRTKLESAVASPEELRNVLNEFFTALESEAPRSADGELDLAAVLPWLASVDEQSGLRRDDREFLESLARAFPES